MSSATSVPKPCIKLRWVFFSVMTWLCVSRALGDGNGSHVFRRRLRGRRGGLGFGVQPGTRSPVAGHRTWMWHSRIPGGRLGCLPIQDGVVRAASTPLR